MPIPVLDLDALRRGYRQAEAAESHAWAAYQAHKDACGCRVRTCAEQDRLIAAWRERAHEVSAALDRWAAELDTLH